MSAVWRPESEHIRQKNMVLAARTDGTLAQYHALNGKFLCIVDPYKEQRQNSSLSTGEKDSFGMPSVYCVDYSVDGAHFAAGAKSGEIFIYDEMAKKKVLTLGASSSSSFNNDLSTISGH